jgi:hypothetical protein
MGLLDWSALKLRDMAKGQNITIQFSHRQKLFVSVSGTSFHSQCFRARRSACGRALKFRKNLKMHIL